MTPEEAKNTVEKLRAEGLDEEEMLYAFYRLFQDEKITIEGLEGLVETIGWHLTEEFKSMSPEEQKTKGYEEIEDEEGRTASEAEIEAAKEYPDKADEVSETNPQAEEEETEKEAMKLFGVK